MAVAVEMHIMQVAVVEAMEDVVVVGLWMERNCCQQRKCSRAWWIYS
jgi:hypothetical protein